MSPQKSHPPQLPARLGFVLALIVAAALSRLLPHPPNFTPVVAVALFAGAQLAPRWLALVVPLLALALTDLVYGFHVTLPAVYLAVALIVLLGDRLGRAGGALRIGGLAVGSSLLFFVLSNAAVWLFAGLYPLTPGGLAACYIAALPFLGNTLAGTLFYVLLLFGGLRLATPLLGAPREAL